MRIICIKALILIKHLFWWLLIKISGEDKGLTKKLENYKKIKLCAKDKKR